MLAYNVAGMDVPVLNDEYSTVDMGVRAKRISEIIKAGQYDIVALSEVWDNPFPNGSMRDEFLAELSAMYPYHVDQLGGSGLPGSVDSGLMLFSKFPFVTLAASSGSQECFPPIVLKCVAAFHEFDASAGEDGLAAKGIGYVRVSNPRADRETDVFFTHLQADPRTCVPEPPGCGRRARAEQVDEAIDFINAWAPPYDQKRDAVLLGDLNIQHQDDAGKNTNEYQALIADPTSGLASIGFADAWLSTSRKDPMSTWTASPNSKIDYILYRQPYIKGGPAVSCVLHQSIERQFLLNEPTANGVVVQPASDHHPYTALIGPRGQHCSPSPGVAQEVAAADATYGGAIEHPGSYQWFHFPPATYGLSINAQATMEMTAYAETDLSTALRPYRGTGIVPGGSETPESAVLSPAVPFYLRVRVADQATPLWTGGYTLRVNWHDGSSAAEAIQLDVFRPYAATQMAASANPLSEVWFTIKTDTLTSGAKQGFTFETSDHPGMRLDMRLLDKTKFDAGAPDALVLNSLGTEGSTIVRSPDPFNPNDPDETPIAAQETEYYLPIAKTAGSRPGPFTVTWTTNLFYVHLDRIQVLNLDDDPEWGENDEPEPIIDVDGVGKVQPMGSMDVDESHDFQDWLQPAKAGTDVKVHMYENQVASSGGCAQAPTGCQDLGLLSIAPTNSFGPRLAGVDLDPVERTDLFFNGDGLYKIWFLTYRRIDR